MRAKTSPDRPTQFPGGMECMECGIIFIGDECHRECGYCLIDMPITAILTSPSSELAKEMEMFQ